MTVVSDGMLGQLIARRSQIRATCEAMLLQARNEGRENQLRDGEKQRVDAALGDIRALTARITELSDAAEQRSQIDNTLTDRFGPIGADGTRPTSGSRTPMNNQIYRKHGRASYIRDLICLTNPELSGAEEARGRLREYAEERSLSRVDGDGGYFSPPAWLVDEFIPVARAGRTAANLLSMHPLPSGVDVINVPRIDVGTDTAIQTADNTAVFEQDIQDSFVTAPIRTIAGQSSISLQLLEMSPVNMDDVLVSDLAAAAAVNVDKQCLYGTGTGGQILGLSLWPGINTVTVADQSVQSLYSALAHAISQVWTKRFASPDCVLMHPVRWANLLQKLDQDSRPLFLPETNHPMNAAGIQDNVAPEGRVGSVMGIPIYTDANLSTTLSSGSGPGTDDSIFVMKAKDIVLYESGQRIRVMPEPLAQTLTVLIQLYEYLALAVRFPASICEITGLAAPTF